MIGGMLMTGPGGTGAGRPRRRRRPPGGHVRTLPGGSLPAEVDEDPAEVLGVLLDAVIQRPDLLLLQEPEHLPGMISTSGAFVRTASSMMSRSARSMSRPRL